MNEQEFDCCFFGGKVTAQQVNVMRHWKSHYILIENVPTHVCIQCSERYYDGIVAEAMDRIMRVSETELGVKREIRVPVIEMPAIYPFPQRAGATLHDKPSE